MKLSGVTETAMSKIAEALARSTNDGARLSLVGDLGAGKTTFTKAFAGALGFDSSRVNSPTFNIVLQYDLTNRKLFHIDLYRLETQQEAEILGLFDIVHSESDIVICEWADQLELMPTDSLTLTILHDATGESRSLHFEAGGPQSMEWLSRLEKSMD